VLAPAADGATVRLTVVLAVKDPDVPVMVIVAFALAAVLAAVKITAALAVAEEGLKAAVTPLGTPAAVSETLPLKPFCPVIAIVPALFAPGLTLNDAGVAVSVKLGGAVTVSAIVALALSEPAVPVTVTVAAPVAAEVVAVRVRVLVVLVELALKLAVTPLGRPVALRVTLLANPFSAPTEIVLVTLAPGTSVRVAGEEDSVKLGGAATVRVIAALLESDPEVAVTVTVAAPIVAVAVALSVSVLVLVVDAGLNDPVTPVGKPETVSATLPVNPFCGTTVIVLVPEPPCNTLRLAGDAVMV